MPGAVRCGAVNKAIYVDATLHCTLSALGSTFSYPSDFEELRKLSQFGM